MKKLIKNYWENAHDINGYLIGAAIGLLLGEIVFFVWAIQYAINYIY